MAYTGVRSNGESIIATLPFASTAAVTAGQVLGEITVAHYGRINGLAASAVTAGTGAGNTVLDVQKNGTSIYTVVASRPTLAAASTGLFTNKQANVRNLVPGDRITVTCLSISTTGHARVSGQLCIEDA